MPASVAAVLGGVVSLLTLYGLIGLAFPRLPLIGSRKRAAIVFVGGAIVFTAIQQSSPALRQQQEQERVTAEADRAQKARDKDLEASRRSAAAAEEAANKWRDATIDLAVLIGEYKNNELAGDQKYKGKPVQVTGVVREVKKDILGSPYVVVATRDRSELRAVQCFLTKASVNEGARLDVGQQVTVRGNVKGLMMNVLVDPCEIQ